MAKKYIPKTKPRKPGSKRKQAVSPKVGIPEGAYDPIRDKPMEVWRAKCGVGRQSIIDSPESLWAAAVEYFNWCDENPLYEMDWKKDGGRLVQVKSPKKRPYTHSGLSVYMGVSVGYIRGIKHKRKDADKFASVIQKIDEAIKVQKFDGAASGFFNATIIARDLGLREQVDNNISDKRADISELFPFKEQKKK